jgi:hypothetical protein
MIVFRFRSLEAKSGVTRAFDIIENKRLYLADWKEMNDPAEGFFFLSHSKRADAVIYQKEQLRLCSFTQYYANSLLWSYYAGGFNGICIALEFSANELNEVRYLKRSPEFYDYDAREPRELALDALTTKLEYWRHEAEFRVIRNASELTERKYLNCSVVGVFYGSEISEPNKAKLLNLCANEIPTAEASIQPDSSLSKCDGISNNISLTDWRNRPSAGWVVTLAGPLQGWMHQGERLCQICGDKDIRNIEDSCLIEDFLEGHYLDPDCPFKHDPNNTALLCPSCHRKMHLDRSFEEKHIQNLKIRNKCNR